MVNCRGKALSFCSSSCWCLLCKNFRKSADCLFVHHCIVTSRGSCQVQAFRSLGQEWCLKTCKEVIFAKNFMGYGDTDKVNYLWRCILLTIFGRFGWKETRSSSSSSYSLFGNLGYPNLLEHLSNPQGYNWTSNPWAPRHTMGGGHKRI